MKDYSAETGETLVEDAIRSAVKTAVAPLAAAVVRVISPGSFAHLALSAVTPSLANPRKTFDAGKMAELVDSVKASGVHQPILVRPLPGTRLADTERGVQYEIIAGERRYRASVEAGLPTIPAMIRALTDDQALEVMLVENVMRDDLAPLEEAEGYEALMQHAGLTSDQVAAKIGKSRSYVYAKLKLLDLGTEARQALRDGKIDASRALLIARIPDSKLQIKALNYATQTTYHGDVPSVRTLSQWLVQNVMLKLDHAPFQITDARLVEAAGSCKECPKRTGAAPDLFADVDGADICTDPACYTSKTDAHREQIVSTAIRKGMRLVDGAEAKEIIPHLWETGPRMLQGYTRLDQQRADVAGGGDAPSLRNLLAGVDLPGSNIEAILIEHPRTKELIEAVPTAQTEALLLARGLVREGVADSGRADAIDRAEREIQYIKDGVDRRVLREGRQAVWKTLVDVVHACADPMLLLTPDLIRAWLLGQCDVLENDDLAAAFNLPDIEGDANSYNRAEQARQAAQRIGHADLYRAMVILMMIDDQPSGFSMSQSEATPLFDAVAKAANVDTAAVMAETKAAIKAEVAEKIRELKAAAKPPKPTPKPKAAQGDPPLTPAAQAGGVRAGAKGGAKGSSEPAPLRKRKVSAAEAQESIAAAMQDLETGSGADAQGIEAASGFALAAPPAGRSDAPAGPDAPGDVLAVGVRVVVRSSVTAPTQTKWIGKAGTITSQVGPQAWDVTFKGRTGGLSCFFASDLQWQPVAAAENRAIVKKAGAV